MGDYGGPLLSRSIELPTRVKSGALHVENCQSAGAAHIHLPTDLLSTTPRKMDLKESETVRPVDSAFGSSSSTNPAETSDAPSKPLPDAPQSKDFAAKAPRSSHSSGDRSKPFTYPNFKPHPRCWVDDGPEFGKAMAKWRGDFVHVLEESTEGYTNDERSKYFEKLIRSDEDHYLQAIATYYTVHLDQIPERELDDKTRRKFEEGMKKSPKYDMAQQKCFGPWMESDSKWGPRTTEMPEELGPKNETSPDVDAPECEHCVKKGTSFLRRAARKLSLPKSESKRRRAATESVAKDRPAENGIAIPKTSEDDHPIDDGKSGSSSDDKEREAHTETGAGMAKAIKKRTSIAQKLRLSTVHTR